MREGKGSHTLPNARMAEEFKHRILEGLGVDLVEKAIETAIHSNLIESTQTNYLDFCATEPNTAAVSNGKEPHRQLLLSLYQRYRRTFMTFALCLALGLVLCT